MVPTIWITLYILILGDQAFLLLTTLILFNTLCVFEISIYFSSCPYLEGMSEMKPTFMYKFNDGIRNQNFIIQERAGRTAQEK